MAVIYIGQKQKHYRQIKNNTRNVTFDDVKYLLVNIAECEIRSPKGGSSHFSFVKKGVGQITIPNRRPTLLSIYVENALDLFEKIMPEEFFWN